MLPGATVGSAQEDANGVVILAVQGPLTTARKPMAEIYTLTCKAALGDARCKFNLASITQAVVGQALSFFEIQLTSVPAGFGSTVLLTPSALGMIIPQSGPLTGILMPIRSFDVPTNIVLTFEPFAPINFPAGSNFHIYAGCDKRMSTCRDVFNNIVNMRATPYAPGSDLLSSRS